MCGKAKIRTQVSEAAAASPCKGLPPVGGRDITPKCPEHGAGTQRHLGKCPSRWDRLASWLSGAASRS